MKKILFYIFYIYFISYCSSDTEGWGYINLHCRDNSNAPVDWWYIYKPPADVVPFFELGRNFTFITPASLGRWEPSDTYITSNSMLQHTLSPIFRPTYTDYLAVAIYDQRKSTRGVSGSVARGVLMADERGGVWIDHTVPGLVNVGSDRPSFPEKESAYGHLLMCISLDLDVINSIAHNLRQVYPKLTYFKMPKRVQPLLPGWNFLDFPLKSNVIKSQEFVTRGSSIRVQVLTRPPGDTHSVYEIFANSKRIFLDVYRHRKQICTKKYGYNLHRDDGICLTDRYDHLILPQTRLLQSIRNFGVRSIQSISLKYPDSVYYLNNETDKINFAVSTAAHWQTLGSGPLQYWTCISNLNSEVKLGLGGNLVCVEDYKVWLTFDNMKVKEPEC